MPIGPIIFVIIYGIIKWKVPPPPNEVITPSGIIRDEASFGNMVKSLSPKKNDDRNNHSRSNSTLSDKRNRK